MSNPTLESPKKKCISSSCYQVSPPSPVPLIYLLPGFGDSTTGWFQRDWFRACVWVLKAYSYENETLNQGINLLTIHCKYCLKAVTAYLNTVS